jgi:hypothetical protein
MALLLTACWQPSLPEIPGMPKEWGDIPNFLKELGLPDLSNLGDIPGLDQLPKLQTPPGAIIYNGPIERRINPGEQVPGTNLLLVSVAKGQAEFTIDGLRTLKSSGDSLDFDGLWPQTPDIQYNLRMRIYRVASDHIRAAGVHQLLIPNIQPSAASAEMQLGGFKLKFPFTVNAANGQTIAGTTLGYGGSEDRGGIVTGLPEGEYPYRKAADSIRWIGMVRTDVAAEYNVRLLFYNANSAQVAGFVTVALPTQ